MNSYLVELTEKGLQVLAEGTTFTLTYEDDRGLDFDVIVRKKKEEPVSQ